MAKNGPHTYVSLEYCKSEFGPWKHCNRRTKRNALCNGAMVEVWVRYQIRGRIYKEHECVNCGKAIKDPQWFIDRDKYLEQRRNNPNQRGYQRGNRRWNQKSSNGAAKRPNR